MELLLVPNNAIYRHAQLGFVNFEKLHFKVKNEWQQKKEEVTSMASGNKEMLRALLVKKYRCLLEPLCHF